MSGRSQRAQGTEQSATPPLLQIFQILVRNTFQIFLIPVRVFSSVLSSLMGTAGPPLFHLVVIFALIPLIALWSLGAGLVVRSWMPQGWKQVVYLQYGNGQAPYADIALPSLSNGQPYDISLELIMPLHAKNIQVGNFMTSITISTPTNVTLATSSRPSLIFPQPLAFAPLFYSGMLSTHSIEVPLLEGFSASSYLSSLRARIQVGRQDGWASVGAGHGQELVIVEAFARGLPKMSGIRGFLAKHSLLLLALTTSAFFVATCLTTLFAYLYFAPALKLSAAPQPSSTTEYKVIKGEGDDEYLEGNGTLPRIKEEEDDNESGLYTDEEDEATVTRSQVSETPLSLSTEDDDGSGSEVNVSVGDALH